MDLLANISLSGVMAATAGYAVSENNVANASTPGYSKQTAVQTEGQASSSQFGLFGMGTDVSSIRSSYSSFLQKQADSAQSSASAYDAQTQPYSQLLAVIGSQSSVLPQAVSGFFLGLQNMQQSPTSLGVRQASISALSSMSAAFNSAASDISEISSGISSQIKSAVDTVNSLSARIASLNSSISAAMASDPSSPPNSLLDQRGQALTELSKQIGFSQIDSPKGGVSITIGNGQPLVIGDSSFALTTVANPSDPSSQSVAFGNPPSAIPNSYLTEGAIGGLLRFSDSAAAKTAAVLDQTAAAIVSGVNSQQSLGQDLNGNPGHPILSASYGATFASPSNPNGATATIASSDPSKLLPGLYSLKYSGGAWQFYDPNGSPVSTSFSSGIASIPGLSVAASAPPSGTAQFGIAPFYGAASSMKAVALDPSSLAAAAAVSSSSTSSNVGNGVVSQPTASSNDPNLRSPISITFNNPPSTFDVIGNVTAPTQTASVPYSSGTPISYNGWTVSISGTPAAGDSFSINPTQAGSSDSSNAVAMSELSNAKTVFGASYLDAMNSQAASLGQSSAGAAAMSASQNAYLSQINQTIQSVSGVDMNQEAANLAFYSQQYQASAKAAQIASSLFNSILAIQ